MCLRVGRGVTPRGFKELPTREWLETVVAIRRSKCTDWISKSPSAFIPCMTLKPTPASQRPRLARNPGKLMTRHNLSPTTPLSFHSLEHWDHSTRKSKINLFPRVRPHKKLTYFVYTGRGFRNEDFFFLILFTPGRRRVRVGEVEGLVGLDGGVGIGSWWRVVWGEAGEWGVRGNASRAVEHTPRTAF